MNDETEGVQLLNEINLEIGRRETQRDAPYFRSLLAPAFVMRRANDNRDSVGRDEFLEALGKATPKDRETRVESVVLVGEERAIVTCVVTMDGRSYHNLRLFVRDTPNEGRESWLLFAWVNEPIS